MNYSSFIESLIDLIPISSSGSLTFGVKLALWSFLSLDVKSNGHMRESHYSIVVTPDS
jgi:hypothetical protein